MYMCARGGGGLKVEQEAEDVCNFPSKYFGDSEIVYLMHTSVALS